MIKKNKKVRYKPGQIFRVPLKRDEYGYGQTLDSGCIFFDYKDDAVNSDPNFIINKSVLFEVGVDYYAIEDGLWKVIANLPIKSGFEKSNGRLNGKVFSYSRDINGYLIWKSGTEKVLATPEEIKDLECFSSWGHQHVEQRLLDYFEGRPNYTYESMHNRHNPDFPKGRKAFYAQYGYTMKEDEEDYEPAELNHIST